MQVVWGLKLIQLIDPFTEEEYKIIQESENTFRRKVTKIYKFETT